MKDTIADVSSVRSLRIALVDREAMPEGVGYVAAGYKNSPLNLL